MAGRGVAVGLVLVNGGDETEFLFQAFSNPIINTDLFLVARACAQLSQPLSTNTVHADLLADMTEDLSALFWNSKCSV